MTVCARFLVQEVPFYVSIMVRFASLAYFCLGTVATSSVASAKTKTPNKGRNDNLLQRTARFESCLTQSGHFAESVMWPQVPQVYQTYRIWQLIRGCYLVSVLRGPDWLWALQACLIVLWVFNFGVVMSWTPWLYRWHLQPGSEHAQIDKSK